jgi:uncharacterized RDD family membrane protein YckC
MHEAPPFPPRPEFEPSPRHSSLPILLAGIFGVFLAALFSVLTIGYFLPLFILGGTMFAVIFLQYVLWGWWFEKIYRRRSVANQEEEVLPKEL